jgi:hypothetical protein
MINLDTYADPEGFDPNIYAAYYDLAFFEKCISTMPIMPRHPITEIKIDEIRHLQGLSQIIRYKSVRIFLEVSYHTEELVVREIWPSNATHKENNELLLSTILVRNNTAPQLVEEFLRRFSQHYLMLKPPRLYAYDKRDTSEFCRNGRHHANEIAQKNHKEFMMANNIHVVVI